jgi:hypothetical protein
MPATITTKNTINNLRSDIETVVGYSKGFIKTLKELTPENFGSDVDYGEIFANSILALRHLEDAKMRLGKCIQAIEGQSVYDTPAN